MTGGKYKILLILIEPPLPFGNAASRWFHVLTHGLIEGGHDVDIMVASGVDADINKAKEKFKDWPSFNIYPFEKAKGLHSKIKTFLFPQRFSFSSEFMARLKELNPASYDIIHVEQTWAMWPVLPWLDRALINVHFLQAIDLADVVPATIKQKLTFWSWFRAEKQLLKKAPQIRTCSPRLTEAIKRWGPKPLLETVPFGIDLSLYPFIEKSKRQTQDPIITLIGNMNWYPSFSAAQRLIKSLWPQIKAQVPRARLRVVGWGARTALKDFTDSADIEILENVPDIRPYFEQASLLIYAPSRGSGMKIKIQEALAFGVPVVTTSEGAEGLRVRDMEHMGLADDDAGLVERAVRILNSVDLQESLRLSGRQMLEEQCGPHITVRQIEAIYHRIVKSRLS